MCKRMMIIGLLGCMGLATFPAQAANVDSDGLVNMLMEAIPADHQYQVPAPSA